jgi:hypothetical protein
MNANTFSMLRIAAGKISPKTNGESLKIINKQPEIEHFECIVDFTFRPVWSRQKRIYDPGAFLTHSYCSAHVHICWLLFLSASQFNRRRTPPRVKFFSSPRFSSLRKLKVKNARARHKKPRKIGRENVFLFDCNDQTLLSAFGHA